MERFPHTSLCAQANSVNGHLVRYNSVEVRVGARDYGRRRVRNRTVFANVPWSKFQVRSINKNFDEFSAQLTRIRRMFVFQKRRILRLFRGPWV